MKPFRNLTIAMLAVALIGADATNAWQQVRDGLAAFRDGDFASADAAFEKAESLKSADRPQQASRIRFNRACAKAALDESDTALEFFRDAARDRAAGLSAEAHYNMGCLAADRAKAVFGDDPAAADVKTREDGLKYLQTAIVHYRDARRIDSKHENARHNLEVIRLWIKQMQAVWEERDRRKAREEKDLLQFLIHIEQQQLGIRQLVRILDTETDSPRRRQAVMDVESRQRLLAQEIGPLKEKILAQFEQQTAAANSPNATPPAGSPPDPEMLKQIDRAIEQLSEISDQVGARMVQSADELESQLLAKSVEVQESALKRLLDFYLGIAPFPHLLDRSIQEQQQLVTESPASSVDDQDDSGDGESDESADSEQKKSDEDPARATHVPPADAAPTYDFTDAAWRQARISDYARAITILADGELKTAQQNLTAIEQQLAELPDDQGESTNEESTNEESTTEDTAPDDGKRPDDGANESETPDDTNGPAAKQQPTQREQLLTSQKQNEQMVAAMQLAIDHGPRIMQRTKAATDQLQVQNDKAALPEQSEALRMLKEIKDALPKQDENQDQKNNEQQKDQQQQQDQNQQEQDKSDQKKPDENQQGNEDDKKQDKDEQQKKDKQQSDQQQQKKSQQTSRQQAEAMLRKVRERERKHRELKDKLRRALMIPGKVERDW